MNRLIILVLSIVVILYQINAKQLNKRGIDFKEFQKNLQKNLQKTTRLPEVNTYDNNRNRNTDESESDRENEQDDNSYSTQSSHSYGNRGTNRVNYGNSYGSSNRNTDSDLIPSGSNRVNYHEQNTYSNSYGNRESYGVSYGNSRGRSLSNGYRPSIVSHYGPAFSFGKVIKINSKCRAINPTATDFWCNANCLRSVSYCPKDFCICSSPGYVSQASK